MIMDVNELLYKEIKYIVKYRGKMPKKAPVPEEYIGHKTRKQFYVEVEEDGKVKPRTNKKKKKAIKSKKITKRILKWFNGQVMTVGVGEKGQINYNVRYEDGDEENIPFEELKKILTSFPSQKYTEYKEISKSKDNNDIEFIENDIVQIKTRRSNNKSKAIFKTKDKTLTIDEELIDNIKDHDASLGEKAEDMLPESVYDVSKLYVSQTTFAKELQELMEKQEDKLPASFQDKFALLELKPEFITPPKRELLMTNLLNGTYHSKGSNSDKNIASKIKTFTNQLPSFKKFKNNDNLHWIFRNHLLLFKEIMEHHLAKESSLATIRTYINAIVRSFTISYGKSHPLQGKYSLLNMVLKNTIDEVEGNNERNEIEQSRYLHWNFILQKTKQLQRIFNKITNKKSKAAYEANLNLMVLSVYTLSRGPQRRELLTLDFTTDETRTEGDFILFKANGDVVFDLNDVKKRHPSIQVPIEGELLDIVKQSYELYPREFVFTSTNKYPDVSKKASEAVTAKRLNDIFKQYYVSIGPSSLRSSYVSYRFHQEAEKNGMVTMNIQREMARWMRTSVEMLNESYAKIKSDDDVLMPIDPDDFDKDDLPPRQNPAPTPGVRVATPALRVDKDTATRLKAAQKAEQQEIDKMIKKREGAAQKERERLQKYYKENKDKVRQQQNEYYMEKSDPYTRNRNRAINKLKKGLPVLEGTLEKYNINPDDYK
jgi:hypothetical protein